MAHAYKTDGIPFLRSQNIKPGQIDLQDLKFIDANFHAELSKSALRPGDVAIVRTGYPGTAAVVPASLPISNCSDLVLIRPGENLNPHFVAAVFNSTFGQTLVSGNTVGAAQQHFNVTVAKDLKLRIPPKDIQDKIAAVLGAYDDLIEANRRRIALLEKLAEELYREWFVRLRFPGHANTKITKGLPAGWIIKRLGEVLELRYGKALKEEDRVPGPFLVFGSSGVVGTHTESHVAGPGLIVGRKGNVGSVFLADSGFFVIDTAFYVVSSLPDSFLYFLLRSMNFINNDSAVPGLNRNQAYANQFFLPSDGVIADFAKIVDTQFAATRNLRAQNANLTRTRDLLLPRLISGKLAVEHLDIAFPPSLAAGG
jgi:type I restriction enzyme S subunit